MSYMVNKKNSAKNLNGGAAPSGGLNLELPPVMLQETSINAYTSIPESGCYPHTNFEINGLLNNNHQNTDYDEDQSLKIFLASLAKVLKVGSTEMKV